MSNIHPASEKLLTSLYLVLRCGFQVSHVLERFMTSKGYLGTQPQQHMLSLVNQPLVTRDREMHYPLHGEPSARS